LQRCAYSKAWV